MDKALRNTLRNVVTQCRKLLEEAVGEVLQGQFGIHADGKVEEASHLTLSGEDLRYRDEVHWSNVALWVLLADIVLVALILMVLWVTATSRTKRATGRYGKPDRATCGRRSGISSVSRMS